jgi:ABC-type phosphate transport system auxiliary subunit
MVKKKKQSMLAWLLDQGVGSAYTVLLALSVGLTKWAIIGILFLIAWWERIR